LQYHGILPKLQKYFASKQVLSQISSIAGVPISARDILSDLKLKETVKAYSNWPTFPQIFIKGEFVGGSDIILSMHQKGELKELLGDIAQKGEQNDSS